VNRREKNKRSKRIKGASFRRGRKAEGVRLVNLGKKGSVTTRAGATRLLSRQNWPEVRYRLERKKIRGRRKELREWEGHNLLLVPSKERRRVSRLQGRVDREVSRKKRKRCSDLGALNKQRVNILQQDYGDSVVGE